MEGAAGRGLLHSQEARESLESLPRGGQRVVEMRRRRRWREDRLRGAGRPSLAQCFKSLCSTVVG